MMASSFLEFKQLNFKTLTAFDIGTIGTVDDVAFHMLFQPGSIPAGLITSIAGTRYDYLTEADEIAGIETAFPSNVPTITWRGLRAATAYTNYFLNSKTPVTQTITFAAAGTYTCYHYGTGSVTVSGASTGNDATVGTGAGTRSSAVTFTTASAGMAVTFTVAGSVNRCQVSNGSEFTPFIPTEGSAKASVTESVGYQISKTTYPNFRSDLSGGADGSGEIIIKFTYPKFRTLPSGTIMSLIPIGAMLQSGSYGDYDTRFIASDDTGTFPRADYSNTDVRERECKVVMGNPPAAIKTKYSITGTSKYQSIVNVNGAYISTPLDYDKTLRLREEGSYGTYLMSIALSTPAAYYLKSIKILKTPKSWV